MFDAISRLFTNRPEPHSFVIEPKMAVAALLVHLAAVDGAVSAAERATVTGALQDFYDLSPDEVERLVVEATRRDAESVDFYRFTSALASLPDEEKIQIIRMMWQVVYADKENHELEDNMVWRIAELIHVSSRDRTTLRNQIAHGAPQRT